MRGATMVLVTTVLSLQHAEGKQRCCTKNTLIEPELTAYPPMQVKLAAALTLLPVTFTHVRNRSGRTHTALPVTDSHVRGSDGSSYNAANPIIPDSTCLPQKSLGQCKAISGAAPGLPEGFCQKTCGRCTCTATSTPSSSSNTPTTSPSTTADGTTQLKPTACTCTDSQPDSMYTCAQQKSFGKCSESFVAGKGHCQTTCGQCKCNPACKCDDVQPPGSFTCAQQVKHTHHLSVCSQKHACLLSNCLHNECRDICAREIIAAADLGPSENSCLGTHHL